MPTAVKPVIGFDVVTTAAGGGSAGAGTLASKDGGTLLDGWWNVITRAYVLSIKRGERIGNYQALVQIPGALISVRASEGELLRGDAMARFRVVSHRWEDPDHPDPDGTKVKELQTFLKDNQDVEGIWADYPCLPQGRARTDEEKRYFDQALRNMNLLYMGSRTIAFVDVDYRRRFWTQFEFFCATHKADVRGIVPRTKKELQHHIKVIALGVAKESNGADEKALFETWANKTVDQAIEILGHKDVSITNQSEKDPMLRRLKEFEQRVMQIESDWVPVEFRDSITNGFMEDPVIAEDGRTYSRESIIGWIESCKAKGEPVTS